MAQSASGFSPLSVPGAGNRQARPDREADVDHRRPDVAVPGKFLDRPDVRTRLEPVGGEAVPQRVAAERYPDDMLGPDAGSSWHTLDR